MAGTHEVQGAWGRERFARVSAHHCLGRGGKGRSVRGRMIIAVLLTLIVLGLVVYLVASYLID